MALVESFWCSYDCELETKQHQRLQSEPNSKVSDSFKSTGVQEVISTMILFIHVSLCSSGKNREIQT